ncbi:ribosomal protein S18-alanine N-acetyltransferase [Lacisediminihabitans changchengi]|uniref:Ribosomal protein S18-alanine N-acetyltransferase n=1 Tax=Lacisediminihabitans changchengi TaxID=2787634 RepID=A0A934SN37_9MICO|nr:ribosomal protein S18-alanine N-acetyltransferase [Lacisediminihabitans changchengi]MBK4348354.1 ribosomal protein S18-alanine N-acetyltransferase [Lacisediminihabitans changchengi]
MTWKLRRATEADLDPIMHLETSTFTSDAWTPTAMLGDLRSRHCYYLVAERVDDPAVIEGYAGLFAPEGAQEGDIQTIAVAASARRGGLGRALMQALITEATKRGARELFLEVRADNPNAQHLYETLGFEEIAVRVAYYQPDGVDANVMRLAIEKPRLSPAVGHERTAAQQ